MSAKDERARDILRGFKLYPPGSRGGAGRTWEEAGACRSRAVAGRQVGTGKKGCERGLERNGVPGPREGPRTGGGHRDALREEGDVDGASGDGTGGAPGLAARVVGIKSRCPVGLVRTRRLGRRGSWSAG